MNEDSTQLVILKSGKKLVIRHCKNAIWNNRLGAIEIVKTNGRIIFINADEVLAVGNIEDFGIINFEGETNE